MPRRGRILFKNKQAGIIEEVAQVGTAFTYDDAWSETIACALPITERRVMWRQGLHPVFQNLGPEGWLRQQQARGGRVQEEDDFGLLLRYGADCIGAISVIPDEEIENGNMAQFGDDTADAAIRSRRTISGVQKKLLAWKHGDQYYPATNDSPATFIAKYAPESTPNLLRNEVFSLSLAQEVLGNDEVTKFRLGEVQGIPNSALLVERFDRTPQGEKLRLEDFAQILSQPRGQDFRGKYESSYELIAEGIKKHSSRPEIDLARFFSALIFNFLIGNADAHLKNWSLLEKPEGLRLSPQYDLLNTLIYGSDYDTYAALEICGNRYRIDEIKSKTILEFGKSIGLSQNLMRLRINRLKRAISRARRLTPSPAEPADGFVNRYSEVVRNGCMRILEL